MAKRIVLLGGGHSHIQVVEALGRDPVPGFEVELISQERLALYSGMLPGVVAGHYQRSEAEIDLAALCRTHGVSFRQARANAIDRRTRSLGLEDGETVGYDLLSIDVGSETSTGAISGTAEHALPVKPLAVLLSALELLLSETADSDRHKRLTIVGGGPSGVEFALALRHRLGPTARLQLVTSGELLPGEPPGVQRFFRARIAGADIALHEHVEILQVRADALELAGGLVLASGRTILATGAAPPAWLGQTGLALHDGFIATRRTLQTLTDPDIFAAGDCASVVADPRPRAGVFAVRAGPILAANLRARALGLALRDWRPQRRYLVIMSAGEKYAVAWRGKRLFVKGRWVWRLKDRIDRRWLTRFQIS